MMPWWYYVDNDLVGPVFDDDVYHAARNGSVDLDTLVYTPQYGNMSDRTNLSPRTSRVQPSQQAAGLAAILGLGLGGGYLIEQIEHKLQKDPA